MKAIAVLGALVIVVSGCASSPRGGEPSAAEQAFQGRLTGTLVTPPLDRPQEQLRDDTGSIFDVSRRPPDEVTVLVFGYTHCPDICPTTAAELGAARQMLTPRERERVQVAFVTEDPQRDTPQVLRHWLDRFDSSFLGVIGGNPASARMLKELYSVATTKLANPEQIAHSASAGVDAVRDPHELEHTSIVYIFAPHSRSMIYTGGTSAEEYAADIRVLLA